MRREVERRRRQPGISIDDVDVQLLRLLHGDARMSARALARAIGMSPNAVSERLERLQTSGVIRGFHIDIDAATLGLGLEVMLGMQISQGRPLMETVEALLSIREVTTVQLVTGHWDLMLTMRVRDQHHLLETLVDRIWKVPEFRHSESLVILESYHTPASWLHELGEDQSGAPAPSPAGASRALAARTGAVHSDAVVRPRRRT